MSGMPFVSKRKNTKWIRRLYGLGFRPECSCIFEEVSRFFEWWVPRRIQDRSYSKDLINLHFGFTKTLTDSAIDIIREIILVIDSYTSTSSSNVAICDFIMKRWGVSEDCAYVFLAYMERKEWIYHGSSMRYAYTTKKSEDFLYAYDYSVNRDNSDLSRFMSDTFNVDVNINAIRGFRGAEDYVPVLLADV